MNPENHYVSNICLKFFYFGYLVKETASLYEKLPLKSAFCGVFLLFLERSPFAPFKIIYFRISRLNFSLEGDERDIFSKTQN